MSNVHRFHDAVAVSVGDGNTTYLTPDEASELSVLLQSCAQDVMDRPYVKSTFDSTEVPETQNAQRIKIERGDKGFAV